MDTNSQSPGIAPEPTWSADNPADTISDAMAILGYNNKQLGNIIGNHRNTVGDWVNGVRPAPRVVRVLLEERIKLLSIVKRITV